MQNQIWNKIWKQEGHDYVCTPAKTDAKFQLKYKEIIIGYLKLSNGEWSFEYDVMFENQNKVHKLIDFPNIKKQYKSNELWPFFSSRIPGLGQPKVQAFIKNQNIDSSNEVELLKAFGFQTITNPFQLLSI
jgi:HipA-like protein